MRTLLGFCIILFTALGVSAQVKVKATPSGKHAEVINTAKTTRDQVKARKAQLKQIKEQKKAIKKYENRYEKLKKERVELKMDSVKTPVWTEQDSIAVANEVLYETNFPTEYRDLILKPVRIDSILLNTIDSSAYNPESLLEAQVKELMPEELAAPGESPLEGLAANPTAGSDLENLSTETPSLDKPSIKKPSKPNPNLVKPEAARELFKKIDPEKFQKVQADISKLKKKYSSMPDTRFPEQGKKRNSLEDMSFKDRIHIGGNVGATSTDPLILDVNLQLGYWINKKWMAGVGIIAREQFNNQDSLAITGDAHGYSLFSRYDILKQFYVWGESQRQVNRSLINGETNVPAKWQESYLIGIGREFKIGPVQMTSLVMYDFNYQSNTLNSRPLVFRLGVQVTKHP